MKCPNCSHEIAVNPTPNNCPECGYLLLTAPIAMRPPRLVGSFDCVQQEEEPRQQPRPAQRQPEVAAPKKSFPWLLTLIAIFAVVGAAASVGHWIHWGEVGTTVGDMASSAKTHENQTVTRVNSAIVGSVGYVVAQARVNASAIRGDVAGVLAQENVNASAIRGDVAGARSDVAAVKAQIMANDSVIRRDIINQGQSTRRAIWRIRSEQVRPNAVDNNTATKADVDQAKRDLQDWMTANRMKVVVAPSAAPTPTPTAAPAR
ncbi:MAG: hypothetical protein WCV83_00700 [Candidatus Magasanikbacteria bacterium]|jgi:hypothetical protein